LIESSAVKQYSKLGSILTENIRTQVEDYSERLSPPGGLYKGFIEDLIFTDLDTEKAAETASQLFGTEKCSFAAIDVLETEPQHVENLWRNTNYFKKAVQDLGFNTGKSQTPIIPIIVGESHKAKALSEKLYERGVFVVPIVYPMVARDQARIRVQMHAKLTMEELDKVIEAFEEIGKELEII